VTALKCTALCNQDAIFQKPAARAARGLKPIALALLPVPAELLNGMAADNKQPQYQWYSATLVHAPWALLHKLRAWSLMLGAASWHLACTHISGASCGALCAADQQRMRWPADAMELRSLQWCLRQQRSNM
jgi:hypothetical protein